MSSTEKGDFLEQINRKLGEKDKQIADLQKQISGYEKLLRADDETIAGKDEEITIMKRVEEARVLRVFKHTARKAEIRTLKAEVAELKADSKGELPKWVKDEYKELLERKYDLVKENGNLKAELSAQKSPAVDEGKITEIICIL